MFPYNARLEGSASPGTLDHAIFQFPNTAAASWWKDADRSGNTTSIYTNTALGCWACSGQGGQPSASGCVLGLMGCCWGELVGSPPTSAPTEPGEIIWGSCRSTVCEGLYPTFCFPHVERFHRAGGQRGDKAVFCSTEGNTEH